MRNLLLGLICAVGSGLTGCGQDHPPVPPVPAGASPAGKPEPAPIPVAVSVPTPAQTVSAAPPPAPAAPTGASAASTPAPVAAAAEPPRDEPDLESDEDEPDKGIHSLPGGGRIYYREHQVALNGMTILQHGPIELFACTEGGKEHESVLRLRCDPKSLNLGIILGLQAKNGPLPQRLADSSVPQGDRVIVTIEWHGPDGALRLRRAEDFVRRSNRNETMDLLGWVFVGSRFDSEIDIQTGQPVPGRTIFAASRYRSVITTWHDVTTILDNPLPEADDDTLYVVNPEAIPPPGTKIRVVVRRPTDPEKLEIAAAEKKMAAAAAPKQAPAETPPKEGEPAPPTPDGPPAPPK